MLKRGYYIEFVRHFFALKVTKKKYLTHLLISAILRTLSFLLIPPMASEIVKGLEDQNYPYAFISIGLFMATAVLYIFCHRYNYWAYYINAQSIHNILQQRILRKVMEFDACFSSDISKATLISTAFRDIDRARQAPDELCDAIVSIFGMLIATIILCTVDIRIGIISFGLLVISLIDFVHHTKKRDRYRSTMLNYSDELSGLYSQIIDGYKEVQTLNLEEALGDYQDKSKLAWNKYYRAERLHRDLAASATPFLMGVGRVLIYLICASLILKGEYDIATLVLVIGYYEEVMDKYDEICSNIDNISRSYVAIERLYRLLSYKTPHAIEFGRNNTDRVRGVVEFKKVNFEYKEPPKTTPDGAILPLITGKYPGLKNVSFKTEPGKLTAIVGKSGSGKSTIFRLLLRFYKVEDGKVLLDDEDIYDYTEEIYARNVSLMSQKPFVFDMTIHDNLSLVDSNREHQIAACRKAGIHETIMKLPKGYDTLLERDGNNLSTGQKQLLSLARILLSKSEVLLFDEVTSSLDSSTTEKVMALLKNLKKDHNVIIITHKPELMRAADQIIVIDKGRIVGEGRHQELMRDNKVYQSLQKIYQT
ncbi:ABC transporter ATP-binding protein [Candidatus Saccharibacteria bacterium]|nr:ABC transporter ATP-binding protein [Candidatus Saccharibacteria bacterium]MBR3144038.1 ABC transporter ATP-binding protein [Candidatus Saccharibacteria bacterium]